MPRSPSATFSTTPTPCCITRPTARYEINLKREFPRLPFYGDFRQWAKWGRALMELHLDYEQAAPFALQRHDRKEPVSQQADLLRDERVKAKRGLDLGDDKPALKPKLKADKAAGTIEVDAVTTLSGIPRGKSPR